MLKMKAIGCGALIVLAGWTGVALAEQDTLVRVHRITGVDEGGVERVLLQDKAGILASRSELPAVVASVNHRTAGQPGVYRDIKVELAGDAYATGPHGYAAEVAPTERVVRMDGSLEIRKSGVRARDLVLSPQPGIPGQTGKARRGA